MAQEHRADAEAPPSGDGANVVHLVDVQDLKNNEIAPAANQEAEITVAAEQDSNEKIPTMEYLYQMRGWLMAVATIFVNMAFDAILHPPEWFKTEWYYPKTIYHGMHTAAPPSPHAADQQDTITPAVALKAQLYLASNAITFANALVLMLVLLRDTPSPRRTLRFMLAMASQLAVSLSFTFALGTAKYWAITALVCFCIVIYAIMVLYLVHRGFKIPIRSAHGLLSDPKKKIKTKQQETRTADEPGSV